MKKVFLHIVFLFFSLSGFAQFYNGSQMDFGKNRVQYDEPRKWVFYKFEKYDVYFYMGGKELGQYVSRQAKKHIEEIERLYDYSVDDKIQFMVFNKQSDFKQSNIGLITDEPYNIGGVTRIAGTKISIYFNGNHADLDRQIRAGIAEVLLNQMMYGGNLKDMLKNSTLLNLPDWYTQGLISYVSNKWDVDIDNRVKDGILSRKYEKFNRLEGQDAVYAGHSIWNYIAETYGESVISNILYMTKVSRNIESSFLFVLGTSLKNLSVECNDYYNIKYGEQDKSQNLPLKSVAAKKKTKRIFTQFKISPDGTKAIYATNEIGQYKVWLADLTTGKTKRILKREHKINRVIDLSYPLLAWHPTGKLFSIITEEKGELHLTYYNLEEKKKETIKIFNFEKILDFSYSDDGRRFVFSAVVNGQSDIFIYQIASANFEQITKDIYDDLNPRFIEKSTKIIFTSNRINDTLKSTEIIKGYVPAQTDIFIYNLFTRSNVLKRVTATPLANESNAFELDSVRLCFLSDENGIRNRYLGTLDSTIAYVDTSAHYRYFTRTAPVTNYSRNIMEQDLNNKSGKYGEVIFKNGKYELFTAEISSISPIGTSQIKKTSFKQEQVRIEENMKPGKSKIDSVSTSVNSGKAKVIFSEAPKKDSSLVDFNNYVFENEPELKQKKEIVKEEKTDTAANVKAISEEFVFPILRNYNIFYQTESVISQIDNTFLNPTYQKFTGGAGAVYLNPGFTGFFKIGMNDLFDDYRIVGGIRFSGDLNSNEYFLSYEDRLKRWDRQIVLHRQGLFDIAGNGASLIKVHTHQAKYVMRYPFSEVTSFRGTLNIRQDRTVFMATDQFNLPKKNVYDYWAGAKAEYVFDNTIKKGLNNYTGTRYKFFAEYFRLLNVEETDVYIVGLDFRHYIKLYRELYLASRLAGSTSFGKQKLIYYMGGVDNWFSPKFDYSIPISKDENFAYQTLATNMRGFKQNIRNGNSFAVMNAELRFSLFRYFINKPIKNDFINNFQIVAFGDVGTAWTGDSPYSDNNALNTTVIGGPPNSYTIILRDQREPIVEGFGLGLRSRLWGYFVRTDWAWGVDGGEIKPRIFYLSFSLDF